MLKFLSRTLPILKFKPSFPLAQFCLVNKAGENRDTPGKTNRKPAQETGKQTREELHPEITNSNIHVKKQRAPEKKERQTKKDQATPEKINETENTSPNLEKDSQLNENTNAQELNKETKSKQEEKQKKEKIRRDKKKQRYLQNKEKKVAVSPKEPKPDPEQQKRREKANIEWGKKTIMQQLLSRNLSPEGKYSKLEDQHFELFKQFKSKLELKKPQMLIPERELTLTDNNNKSLQKLIQNVETKVSNLNLHSQITSNLQKMGVDTLTPFQALFYNLNRDGLNLEIKTDTIFDYEKQLAIIIPILDRILSMKQIPQRFTKAVPLAMVIEKNPYNAKELKRLFRLVAHDTGIKIKILEALDQVDELSGEKIVFNPLDEKANCEVLIIHPYRLVNVEKENLVDFSQLEEIVMCNFNLYDLPEKLCIQNLVAKTKQHEKRLSILHVLNSKFITALTKDKDFRKISYAAKDSVLDTIDRQTVERNYNISHLVVEIDNDIKQTLDHIYNLLASVEGRKIVHVQTRYMAVLSQFLKQKQMKFFFVSERTVINEIYDDQDVIITNNLYLLTGKIISKASIIINLDYPIKIHNFFSLIGKYGTSVTSTVSFVSAENNYIGLATLRSLLKEFNQEVPEFLEKGFQKHAEEKKFLDKML